MRFGGKRTDMKQRQKLYMEHHGTTETTIWPAARTGPKPNAPQDVWKMVQQVDFNENGTMVPRSHWKVKFLSKLSFFTWWTFEILVFKLRLRFPPLKKTHPFEHSGRNGVSSIDAPAKGSEVSSLSESLSDTWHWDTCCFGARASIEVVWWWEGAEFSSPRRFYEIFELIAAGLVNLLKNLWWTSMTVKSATIIFTDVSPIFHMENFTENFTCIIAMLIHQRLVLFANSGSYRYWRCSYLSIRAMH